VKGGYSDGRLDAEDWREQRAELTAALEAAGADAEQLRAREVRLAETRRSIAAGVTRHRGSRPWRRCVRMVEIFELRRFRASR
jgi:hypothetical protein